MGTRVKVTLTFVVDIAKGHLDPKIHEMCSAAVSAAGVEDGMIEPGARFATVTKLKSSSMYGKVRNCGANHDGLVCTREHGHAGRHEAHGPPDGPARLTLIDAWSAT